MVDVCVLFTPDCAVLSDTTVEFAPVATVAAEFAVLTAPAAAVETLTSEELVTVDKEVTVLVVTLRLAATLVTWLV